MNEISGVDELFAEQMQFFESTQFYDCVIRVGSAASNVFKDFKCHKLVLSSASCVFKTMFTGDFKEAKLGRDEPILLDKVEPQVFESAMKFVYGRVKDFKDVSFAAKIYKFAHQMQIDALIGELDMFLKQRKHKDEIFTIFDLYQTLDNQQGLWWCKQVVETIFDNRLESDKHWPRMSSESVEEFLKMDCLQFKEMNLVRALIRWGKFQVQEDGEDPNDGEKLRTKILSGLKLIRFSDVTQTEFAELCLEELGSVLSAKEKNLVMMSLTTKNNKLMPPELSELKNPRTKFLSMREHLPYLVKREGDGEDFEGPLVVGFTIRTKRDYLLLGLEAETSANESFTFEIRNAAGESELSGSSSGAKSSVHGNVTIYKIDSLCLLLEKDSKYTLLLSYHKSGGWKGHLESCILKADECLPTRGVINSAGKFSLVVKWPGRRDGVVRALGLYLHVY